MLGDDLATGGRIDRVVSALEAIGVSP